MPSHSKKQHNFMEAIAHSPSFAKKVHVPQSVGKDYAAADKGKTFRKGGEMKESKAMVGKEMAFMKKKGAPKSMLKHEESEMKGYARGGKVRRMAMGGQGDSAFMTDEDYEKEKKQGAENLKSIKNFFGFGEKEPAPIENREERRKPSSSSSSPSTPPSSSSSSRVSSPRVSESAPRKSDEKPVFTGMGETEYDYPTQRETKTGTGASGFGQTPYQDSGFSALENKRNKPTTVSRTRETTSVTTGKPATGKSDSSYDAIERSRANRSPSSMLSKLRKESEDKIRDSKPGSMTKQMREAPTINDLYRGQKSMSDEFGDVLKSFRSGIRGGLKSGEDKRKLREEEMHIAKGGKVKAYAQGGKVKKMAFGGFGIKPQPTSFAPDPSLWDKLPEGYGDEGYGNGSPYPNGESRIPEDSDFEQMYKPSVQTPSSKNPFSKIVKNPKVQQVVSKVKKAVSKAIPKPPSGLDEENYGRFSEQSARENEAARAKANQTPLTPQVGKQMMDKLASANKQRMAEPKMPSRRMAPVDPEMYFGERTPRGGGMPPRGGGMLPGMEREMAPRGRGMLPDREDQGRRFGMGPQGRATSMPPKQVTKAPPRPKTPPIPKKPVMPPEPVMPSDGPDMLGPVFGRGLSEGPPEPTSKPLVALPQPQQEYGFDDGGYGGGGGDGGGAKAGGRVKKMASGGYTRAADGLAKKGKTQGKVVKMASGGFVKTADGCAQRGKTKAFQVKMNRGGMC
jgi:hypothetical protein